MKRLPCQITSGRYITAILWPQSADSISLESVAIPLMPCVLSNDRVEQADRPVAFFLVVCAGKLKEELRQ